MSQVDLVFSQNPAIVAAYRPRAIHFLSWTVCILHPFEGSTRTIRSETRGERHPTAPALCQWYTWPWSECPWQLQCSWCSGKMRQGCARWCRSWVRARAPWTLISILYLVIPKHHWFNNWLLLSNIMVLEQYHYYLVNVPWSKNPIAQLIYQCTILALVIAI